MNEVRGDFDVQVLPQEPSELARPPESGECRSTSTSVARWMARAAVKC
jgi:hypothetical protein